MSTALLVVFLSGRSILSTGLSGWGNVLSTLAIGAGDPANPKFGLWAAESTERAIQLYPGNDRAWRNLGWLYHRLGYRDRAVEAWSHSDAMISELADWAEVAELYGQCPEAVDWYAYLSVLRSDDPHVWLSSGRALQTCGDATSALSAFREAWRISPGEAAQPLAQALWMEKQYAQADSILRSALHVYPEHAARLAWRKLLGRVLVSQGAWAEAVASYQQGLEEFAYDPELHLYLGISVYESTRSLELAENEVLAAINLNADYSDAYFTMGWLEFREGNHDTAEEWFRACIERNPNIPWWHVVRLQNARLGGEFRLACDICDDPNAMARFADYAPGYFECSQAYTSCNDLAKAVTAIEQAIRVASAPRAEYHSLAGAIYEKLHRHLDAQSAYDRARQLED